MEESPEPVKGFYTSTNGSWGWLCSCGEYVEKSKRCPDCGGRELWSYDLDLEDSNGDIE